MEGQTFPPPISKYNSENFPPSDRRKSRILNKIVKYFQVGKYKKESVRGIRTHDLTRTNEYMEYLFFHPKKLKLLGRKTRKTRDFRKKFSIRNMAKLA